MSCPQCSPTRTTASTDRSQQALLRCAIVHYLEDAVRMAGDDVPLSEVLSGAGHYLNRMTRSGEAVIDESLWPVLDAEICLAVARVAGLRPAGAFDPRISEAIAKAASWPTPEQARLLGMAAFGYRLFMDVDR